MAALESESKVDAKLSAFSQHQNDFCKYLSYLKFVCKYSVLYDILDKTILPLHPMQMCFELRIVLGWQEWGLGKIQGCRLSSLWMSSECHGSFVTPQVALD
jgi:hypothetical protein